MDTKSYLRQIERLDRMIQNKLTEIYQLKTMASNVTVANDRERVQTSADKDRLGATVAKLIDLENETDALIDELVNKKTHIIWQMEHMADIMHYRVLFERYVGKNEFNKIADGMNCSYRHITRLHGEALNEFEKLYGDEYLNTENLSYYVLKCPTMS